jgi:hypothetical protein
MVMERSVLSADKGAKPSVEGRATAVRP